MGHYCYSCDEKLIGGVESTRCDCIECFCKKCWDNLFVPTFTLNDIIVYKKNIDGTFSILEKNLYQQISKKVQCPECNEDWDVDGVEDY
jgi:hypothetical protein